MYTLQLYDFEEGWILFSTVVLVDSIIPIRFLEVHITQASYCQLDRPVKPSMSGPSNTFAARNDRLLYTAISDLAVII